MLRSPFKILYFRIILVDSFYSISYRKVRFEFVGAAMKIHQLIKLALILFAFSGIVACSSSSEEAAPSEVAETGESDADATARRAQELAEEARRRAAAAEERMVRQALATKVFYFDFDVAEFRPADRDVLTYHARDLAANPNKRIRLEGHADERGTREYNLALGERRSNGILNYFIVNGAARNQIETVSYGEERPADRGTTEAAYQRNRRVEIID
jgi:peptidoglycan-associated lipoprotein